MRPYLQVSVSILLALACSKTPEGPDKGPDEPEVVSPSISEREALTALYKALDGDNWEDQRYAQEGLGIYEGAYYYGQGAYRPSYDSIMNLDHQGGFNAPSREAIWYRAHKLAYGPEWEYSYEDFVAYDAVNRSAATALQTKTQQNFVEKRNTSPAPPVRKGKTWRALLRKTQ